MEWCGWSRRPTGHASFVTRRTAGSWRGIPRPAARRFSRWTPLLCALLLAACGSQARALTSATPTATRHPATPTATLPQPAAPADPPSVPTSPRIVQTVDWYVANMTLDEKVGQMIMFESFWQGYNQDIANMVSGMHAGATIIYAKNMSSRQQVRDYISQMQAHADIPMFITMDEEGGNVDRLGYLGFNPPLPSAVYLGGTGDPQLAYQAATRAAQEVKWYGVNTDLAPVVDVRTTPYQMEGPRLYGNDPVTVDRYASQFLQGLQQNGVIGCLKHWPGVGSLTLDPHLTLPTITRSQAQLNATEFAAFRAVLDLQPGMIMVTHALVPAIDPTMPATLSPKLIQGVLRDELGYQGVVITDNLYMKGISVRYSMGEAAVLAVIAGDDLLANAWDTQSMQEMVNALKNAVSQGRITQARIDQSVRRILTLKARYGLLPLRSPHLLQGDGAQVAALVTLQADADLPHAA